MPSASTQQEKPKKGQQYPYVSCNKLVRISVIPIQLVHLQARHRETTYQQKYSHASQQTQHCSEQGRQLSFLCHSSKKQQIFFKRLIIDLERFFNESVSHKILPASRKFEHGTRQANYIDSFHNLDEVAPLLHDISKPERSSLHIVY